MTIKGLRQCVWFHLISTVHKFPQGFWNILRKFWNPPRSFQNSCRNAVYCLKWRTKAGRCVHHSTGLWSSLEPLEKFPDAFMEVPEPLWKNCLLFTVKIKGLMECIEFQQAFDDLHCKQISMGVTEPFEKVCGKKNCSLYTVKVKRFRVNVMELIPSFLFPHGFLNFLRKFRELLGKFWNPCRITVYYLQWIS